MRTLLLQRILLLLVVYCLDSIQAFGVVLPQRFVSLVTRKHQFSSSAVIAVNGEDLETTTTTPTPNIRLNVNEKARTVASVCTSGTLCTVSASDGIQGAPFGSFVDYVLDGSGNPIFLMNEMSMHTINIQSNNIVTLFTQLQEHDNKLGQDVSRCSITGIIQKLERTDPDVDLIRMKYSIAHSYADQVMDSPKFDFYRLTPKKIYYVGGFGVQSQWVEPHDYEVSNPDILAVFATQMVYKLNRDHYDDLVWVATQLLNIATEIEQVRLTSVDRLGMDIRVTSKSSQRRNKLNTDEFRIGFRIPVLSVEDAKSEILKVFQEAWEKGNNVQWENDELEPGASVPILQIAADSLE